MAIRFADAKASAESPATERETRRGAEDLVDEAVLGTAQGKPVEPRFCHEGRWIAGPAVWRGENQGQGLALGRDHFVRRLKLGDLNLRF